MNSATFEIAEHGPRRFIVLKGDWVPNILDVMERENIRDLRISNYAGWRGDSIKFLEAMPSLTRLDLWAVGIKDLSPLYRLARLKSLSLNGIKNGLVPEGLAQLEELSIGGYRGRLDFSKFPQLRKINLGNWKSENYSSVLQCLHVESLAITGLSEADLSSFRKLTQLQELGLASTAIRNLEGISELKRLQKLAIVLANKLESLTGIDNNPRLTYVSVEKARVLADIAAAGAAPRLRELHLSDCPDISSLPNVRRLQNLRYVTLLGTTNVSDGKISILRSLPSLRHVSFVDRRHYDAVNAEFPKSYRV